MRRLIGIALCLAIAVVARAAPLELYLHPSGSDTNNDCQTQGSPCKTFGRLAQSDAYITRGYGAGVLIHALPSDSAYTDAFAPDSGGIGWHADSALVLMGNAATDTVWSTTTPANYNTSTVCDTLPWGIQGMIAAGWDTTGFFDTSTDFPPEGFRWTIRCGRANADSAASGAATIATGSTGTNFADSLYDYTTDVDVDVPYVSIRGIRAGVWVFGDTDNQYTTGAGGIRYSTAWRDSVSYCTITQHLNISDAAECVFYRNRIRKQRADSLENLGTTAHMTILGRTADLGNSAVTTVSHRGPVTIRRNYIDVGTLGTEGDNAGDAGDGNNKGIELVGMWRDLYPHSVSYFDSNLVQGVYYQDPGQTLKANEPAVLKLSNTSNLNLSDNRWDILVRTNPVGASFWNSFGHIRDSTGYFGPVSFTRDTFLVCDRDTTRSGVDWNVTQRGTYGNMRNISWDYCVMRFALSKTDKGAIEIESNNKDYKFTNNVIYNATGPAVLLKGSNDGFWFTNNTVIGEPAMLIADAPTFTPVSRIQNNLFVNYEVDSTSTARNESVISVPGFDGWNAPGPLAFDTNMFWNKAPGTPSTAAMKKLVIKRYAANEDGCVGKFTQKCNGFWYSGLHPFDGQSFYLDPVFTTTVHDSIYGDVLCNSPVASLNIPGSLATYVGAKPPAGNIFLPVVTNFDTSAVADTNATLTWTMPSASFNNSGAYSYDLRYLARGYPTFTPFGAEGVETRVNLGSVGASAGTTYTATIHGLSPCQTYGFVLYIRDVCGNVSAESKLEVTCDAAAGTDCP